MIKLFDDTFKSQVIKIHAGIPYQKSDIMAYKMMVWLMNRCSPRYPTKKQFIHQLESLYGATVSTHIGVLGNQALFTSTIELISGKMVKEAHLLKDVLKFSMHDVFEQTFDDEKFFEQEKKIMIHQLETLDNHKMQFAHLKYKESMLKNHPTFHSLDDQIKTLKALTINDIKSKYDMFLNANRIAFGTGAFTDEEKKLLNNTINPLLKGDIKVTHTPIKKQTFNREFVPLIMDQAIIHLGYHFPVYLGTKEHASAQLMTMILGAHGDSRLFRIVREELGLCYMISAQYDDEKGMLTVITGVDIRTQKQAIKVIKDVVKSMQEDITDKELNDAKASFIHQITSNLDKQSIYIRRALKETLYDRPYDLQKRLDDIQSVSKQDINHVSTKLTLILEHVVAGENHE